MKLNSLKISGRRNLLAAFIGGSMIFIMICLSITAVLFAHSFVKKEQQRAQISREQVEHFFNFQYSNMAEEMWTKNTKAISARVGFIAKEMGNAKYEFVLADASGACLYKSDRNGKRVASCALPESLTTMVQNPPRASERRPELRFDENTNSYVYAEPLYVGSVLKGFLYASLSDPYGFYRGSIVEMATSVLLPAILFILCLWLLWLLACRSLFLKPYLSSLEEMKANESLAKIAGQAAHDMRDPLSWIDKLTASVTENTEEKRIMIKSAVLQLKDIANGLLSHNKLWQVSQEERQPSSEMEVELLSSLIGRIVSEKRIQFKSRTAVQIEAPVDAGAYGLFARIEAIDFKRVLSNLINNAVDALEGKGRVTVRVEARADKVVIVIADTGKGIPPEILPKLGVRGATFGKKRGNGLGLYYSKTVAESWGGTLQIHSKEGQGTVVEISLPKVMAPVWFVPELKLQAGCSIVVLDDHPSIHAVWEDRFAPFSGMIHTKHFSGAAEFSHWVQMGQGDNGAVYLCDYELNDQPENGLELIERLGIERQSILVTSHFEDEEIRASCAELGIKLIPKDLASLVPITIGESHSSAGDESHDPVFERGELIAIRSRYYE